MTIIGLLLISIIGIGIPLAILIHAIFVVIGEFMGAPYVPTSSKIVDEILKEANLKRSQVLVDLGSGDGRVVRRAVKKYHTFGVGIEMHPLLVLYSRALAKLQNLKSLNYICGNMYHYDLSKADVIFMFLLPPTLVKMREKFKKEASGALIISHGFKIGGFEKYLVKKIDRKIFPTYFYRL